MSDSILVLRDGAIATVVVNRVERGNALDRSTWSRLGEAMRELSAEDALRCVVLRGAGEEAFSVGADIAEFPGARADSRQAKAYGGLVDEALQAVARCRHPTVAMIRGACLGGGFAIAATCDLRIAGQSSRFGTRVNWLGLALGHGELLGLVELAGRAVTLEILLEGRVLDAGEACRKGLVSRVVPDDKVEDEAYSTARRIAEGAPLVNRWHKQFIERLAVRARIEPEARDEGYACFDTADYREGVDAFLSKRNSRFEGR